MTRNLSPVHAVLAAAISLTAVSCSAPGVKLLTQPLTETPIIGTLLNPKQLTPSTKAHLQEESLMGVYRKDRAEAIEVLYQRLEEDPDGNRRMALIELCSDTGDLIAATDPAKAVGYHLFAASLAVEADVFDVAASSPGEELVVAYNHSCGQVAGLLFDAGHDWGDVVEFAGPGRTFRLTSRTEGRGQLDPSFFDRFEPAAFIQFENVDLERITLEGIGAAMVGHRESTPERREKNPFLATVGMAMPVNVTLEFSGDGNVAELNFRDLLIQDEAVVGGRTLPLEGDLSAPFAVLHEFVDVRKIGMQGLKDPEKYIDDMGLYSLEPYREDQIPVIFIHGLMSSPYTWVKALNQCRADPALRGRYQLYAIRYPTGFPIAYNATAVRRRLAEFREFHDPNGTNPNMRKMVVIGHSMGGMLTNMQIRSSGDSFIRLLFDQPIDEIEGMSETQKDSIKELLIYEANPDIARAVFVASPHRGSGIASSPLGDFGAKLIKFPMDILTAEPLTEIKGLSEGGREIIKNRPNSISTLRPDAPGPKAVLTQPIRPGVTIHSIIGRANPDDPIEESTDKVVPYTSAHLDEAVSEKVVHATHTSITGDPAAIEEVRRILYLHAGIPYQPAD